MVNIFESKEIIKKSVVANFAITASDGKVNLYLKVKEI